MKKSAAVNIQHFMAFFSFAVLSLWGGVSLAFVPMDFMGTVPESASVTVNVSKPAGATNGIITLSIYDADFPDEGTLVINGNPPIPLFGASGVTANDLKSTNIKFNTPASYWNNGNNSLLFRHTKTAGFVVNDVSVSFAAGNTNTGVPAGSFPVEMLGKAPEQASVTVDVSKPAGAASAVITLASYDADFANEGQLVINGNAPVALFGALGVKGNDQNSADIKISTPASYWKNGANTLIFKHTNTAGFVIDAVSVSFGAATAVTAAAVTPASSFPVEMLGQAPEQESVTVDVSKPAGAVSGVITLTSYDADFANEGQLVINGNAPVALFGSSGVKGNDQNSADIKISTPASYWKNGANTLLFKHTSTAGFAIEGASVSFEGATSTTASSKTPSGPIVINGQRDVVISGVRVTNPNGDCIDIINGASNVIIQNSEIGPCAGKGINILNSSNITISGNHIHDAATEGVRSYQSHTITVDSNVIEDVESGYEMEATNVGNISFTNNFVKNVHRGPTNGGNVVMVAYVHAKGIRIMNNVGINVLGESNAEDLINIFKSDGTAADPILVSNNKFYGGGPSTSSGGIMLGDQGGSYQLAENNILVNPGGYGLALAGGDHNTLRNNKVYSDGQRNFSNVGVSIWRFNYNGKGTPPGQCHSHTVANNLVTWWKGANYKNNGLPASLQSYFNPNFGADRKTPNCGAIAGWSTNKFDNKNGRPANLDMSIWNPAWNTP